MKLIQAALLLVLTVPLRTQEALGQTAGLPDTLTTPQACLDYANGEWDRRRESAKQSGIAWSDSLNAAADSATVSVARSCLARFPRATANPEALKTISELFLLARMRDSALVVARDAAHRVRKDSARAEALAHAIDLIVPSRKDSAESALSRLAEAQELARALDALGARFANAQFTVHTTLASAYGDRNLNEKRFTHLSRMLELIPKLSKEDRRRQAIYIGGTFTGLAQVYEGRGRHQLAREMLLRGLRENADIEPEGTTDIRSALLIGTPAPPLVATHWFNVPTGTTELPPRNTVRLVMLTAHW